MVKVTLLLTVLATAAVTDTEYISDNKLILIHTVFLLILNVLKNSKYNPKCVDEQPRMEINKFTRQ